ncbi:MAG: nucleotidyltransferase family protein [Candidatus Brocadia sp.]|nr:nucleotidyltransferase family protein [Candidatus Brocadia sp.]
MINNGYLRDLITPADQIIVGENRAFKDVIALINNTHSGIALVVDHEKRLIGIVTDGDIRRAILSGILLEEPVSRIMVRNPVTVSMDCTKGEICRYFADKKISHLPVVDKENRIIGIFYETSFRKEGLLDIPVVIMAGGFGKRLRPLTDKVPKPMLKIGEKPILQLLIEKFRDIGVSDFFITINYLADIIENYFADNEKVKANITFIRESKPLGTAGSLRLLPRNINTEFLLTNADIMTNVDFKDMHDFHVKRRADLTVAVKRHDLQVPYGAVTIANERLMGLFEKPVLSLYVNAGIYIVNPELISAVPDDAYFDMTDLIEKSLKTGKKVFSYTIDGMWIDIGHPHDYEQAQKVFC